MDRSPFLSWEIENFSCWNKDLHGTYIQSPNACQFNWFFKSFELYPRDTSGVGEHLVICFRGVRDGFSGGELSFIGSDGSIICTLQVEEKGRENFIYSPMGPKYEYVISKINQMEDKDQLTLRFISPKEEIYEHHISTAINVLKISLELDQHCFLNLNSNSSKYIYFSSFGCDKIYEGIYLRIARKKKKFQFILNLFTNSSGASFLVESCVRLHSHDDDLGSYKENRDVCLENKPWIFADFFELDDILNEGNVLRICLKIISSKISAQFNRVLFDCKAVTAVQVNNEGIPPSKAFPAKQASCSPSEGLLCCDSPSDPNEVSVNVLKKELLCLYQDLDSSDLQLKCRTVSLPVHKDILSAWSPVFKAMLSGEAASSGTVGIEDLDPPTLVRLLAFIYCGAVNDLQSDVALKLYYAADRYEVRTLKATCAVFLRDNLSISNVCDVLSLADRHQDGDLLSAAHDFILTNFVEVARSEEWKMLMKDQPLLAAETLTSFAAEGNVIKKADTQ